MSLLNALVQNAENLSALKELVKSEGIVIEGAVYSTKSKPSTTALMSKLESATEQELEVIADTLGIVPSDVEDNGVSESRDLDIVPDSFLAGENTGEFSTAKGEKVEVVFATYSHKSRRKDMYGNRRQIFKLQNGTSVVIQNKDYVADAIESKLVTRGEYTFPLNRDTIAFLPYENTCTAKPLASHEIFQEALRIKEEKQDAMEAWERELRNSDFSEEEIKDIKKQKALESMPDIFKKKA